MLDFNCQSYLFCTDAVGTVFEILTNGLKSLDWRGMLSISASASSKLPGGMNSKSDFLFDGGIAVLSSGSRTSQITFNEG